MAGEFEAFLLRIVPPYLAKPLFTVDVRHLELALFVVTAAGASALFAETARGDAARGWAQFNRIGRFERSERPSKFAVYIVFCKVVCVVFAIAALAGVVAFFIS